MDAGEQKYRSMQGSSVDELRQGKHPLILRLNNSSNVEKKLSSYMVTAAVLESSADR